MSLLADSPSAPVNVTVKHLKANSAVVTWDVLEDEVVIGFAISQQVRCLLLPSFGHIHFPPGPLSFQTLSSQCEPFLLVLSHGLGGGTRFPSSLQQRSLCRSLQRSPCPWWTGQEAVVSDTSSAHTRSLRHSVLSSLGFQKKDVRMLRFIQEVNTTTRSCALWDLEEDTEYIVHVQAISIQGQSPASEPVLFKTPREAEKLASKNKGKCG